MTQKSVYSVGQLNTYIKNMFSQDYFLQSLTVRGEISNCKYHSTGHIYFTLKDENGSIPGVMFSSNASRLKIRLRDGMQVLVTGSVNIYERDAKVQIYAKEITEDGVGSLSERFEQLKKELEETGMFDACYKQPIPKNPKVVGVVTASTGAAIRDIIDVSKRRNPYIQIVLYPAIVQGPDAAPSVVQGIRALEEYGVDVMIVGRGGGSMEDLWAFNERIVAQAIFDCHVPVISAVGHEIDFTIADFVADMRAPTPSAAAELAVCEIRELLDRIEDNRRKLDLFMDRCIRQERNNLNQTTRHLEALSPEAHLIRLREDTIHFEQRLDCAMDRRIERKRSELAVFIQALKGLSPLDRLSSGYSYAETEGGSAVKSIAQVNIGDRIRIHVADGEMVASVEEKTANE